MMESESDKDDAESETAHDTGSEKSTHDSLVEMASQTSQSEQAAINEARSKSIVDALQDWQKERTDNPIDIETSEFGYPVIDLESLSPNDALALLRQLDPTRSFVYHGMHNNELRRNAGMPDVQAFENLDPAHSHQTGEGRQLVYATSKLEGGLTHAILEHREADLNGDETFALKPNKGEEGQTIELSPSLEVAMANEALPFTNGLLYILPSESFTKNLNSDHEVTADTKVVPIAVIKIAANMGPLMVNQKTVETRFDGPDTVEPPAK
ncbi:MAG: hypothetical protein WCI47_00170 [bacterium]